MAGDVRPAHREAHIGEIAERRALADRPLGAAVGLRAADTAGREAGCQRPLHQPLGKLGRVHAFRVARNHRAAAAVERPHTSRRKSMQQQQWAVSREGVLANVALVVGAAALTAVAAQISFGTPVPTTLQTLAVFATSAVLGARRAVAAQLLYLATGAVGAPVFANGRGGVDIVAQANPLHASGGFLWGFVLAAFVVGFAADRFGHG